MQIINMNSLEGAHQPQQRRENCSLWTPLTKKNSYSLFWTITKCQLLSMAESFLILYILLLTLYGLEGGIIINWGDLTGFCLLMVGCVCVCVCVRARTHTHTHARARARAVTSFGCRSFLTKKTNHYVMFVYQMWCVESLPGFNNNCICLLWKNSDQISWSCG
jgi:hypothetical protein